MDSASEKQRTEKMVFDQDSVPSDEEIIDLIDEVPGGMEEENRPAEILAPQGEEKEDSPGMELDQEDGDISDTGLLADLDMGIEFDSIEDELVSEESPPESISADQGIKPDAETVLSQLPKEELEAIITRTAKDVIGEMAERIVTDVAERLVVQEIERIKSAIR
ncbi:MAG: hypothetical protein BAW33_05230 [Desulfobacterales bacterium C00003104]|nr:MAG: hypothetical protein BAW33_05230 [Desulfobacterales bacterium C00003104]